MSCGVLRTVRDSYITPGLSTVFPWSSVAGYIAYARSVLGFSKDDDCFAASELERLLYEAVLDGRYVYYTDVCQLLQNRTVCVTGGSESLELYVDRIDKMCNVIIAVDGSTTLLVESGIHPSVVIGDLDGRWSSLLEASRAGAVMIVHAHGDNIAAVRALVPLFHNVAGVSQCEDSVGVHSLPPIGFTDGDKALGLILLCSSIVGVKRVELFGMNFSEKVGWWSKPWLRDSVEPWREKTVKLGIGKRLVGLFVDELQRQGVVVVTH